RHKRSSQIYLGSDVCPVPEGSLLPLIFFSFCLFHSDPNPKTRRVLFWFVGVSPETCVVKGETHGFLGGAVGCRKVEAGQWETSSTLDLQSDASEGLFHRRSLPEDELCSGYAVEVHIPAPDGDASRLAGGET
ncbi:hypothetical protein HID58_042625, partial [Brassica napus]